MFLKDYVFVMCLSPTKIQNFDAFSKVLVNFFLAFLSLFAIILPFAATCHPSATTAKPLSTGRFRACVAVWQMILQKFLIEWLMERERPYSEDLL